VGDRDQTSQRSPTFASFQGTAVNSIAGLQPERSSYLTS
jgi:hypothetical protein